MKKASPTPGLAEVIAPPAHLSATSQTLWREIVPRRARSPERLTLLTVALEALDRIAQCREAIAAAGLTFATKKTGAVHVHPLTRLEREARQDFLRAWGLLHLGFDGELDGRPFGVTPWPA